MIVEIAEIKDKHTDRVMGRSRQNLIQALGRTDLMYIEDNLTGTLHHQGYLQYLETCWANHYGAVFSPEILWYDLLCELGTIVAGDVEKYRPLFSTSPDKQAIRVPSNSLTILPLDLITAELKKRVPTDIDTFLPTFTTMTERALFAQYAAFADMVSPYYEYMMFACGIPFVDVRGVRSDYQKMFDCWGKIGDLIKGHERYFTRVGVLLLEMTNKLTNADFWKGMFALKRCGSGGQEEVAGWFQQIYREHKGIRTPESFPDHLAKVKYLQLDTNINYEMRNGLLSSKLIAEKNLLEPEFGHVVFQVKAA